MKKFVCRWTIAIVVICGLFLNPGKICGQKVALVLSGGGSYGAGHIGVIRALEENGIPIDCIVGTSAGAIVGGLYSIGYTPDEIEALMSSQAFQQWAEGKIDDENIFYYQINNTNSSWIKLNLDPNKKITSSLPTNVFASDQMDFETMRLFAPANAVAGENFDSLFVPYRCVVSDVSHSRPVIMKNGQLGRAIRASMSIPFVYQPVVIDSVLCYDGGIFENFPNEAAISDFNPDVIIGSKVTQSSKDASLDEPVLQLLHLIQTKQADTIPFSPSVLIKPDIPQSVGMLNFEETKRLADSGYVATIKKISEIRSHISRVVAKEERDKKRAEFKKNIPDFIVDTVKVTGPGTTRQAYFIAHNLHRSNRRTSIEKFEPEYFKLYGNENITSMFPIASYDSTKKAFTVNLEVHKANPLAVRIGGNVSLSSYNTAFAELRYNPITSHPAFLLINGYFGQSYASMMLSGRMYFTTPHTWYIQGSGIYNRYSFFNTTAYFYDIQERSSITDKTFTGNLRIGIPVDKRSLFEAGINTTTDYGYYYLSDLLETSDTITRTKFRYYNPFIIFDLNTLNRKQYASVGTRIRASFSLVSGKETMLEGPKALMEDGLTKNRYWLRATGLYEHYFRIKGPFYGGSYMELNVSGQPLFRSFISSLTYNQPFQPLPESRVLFLPGYRAPSWGAAGLKAILKLGKEVELRSEGYVFQPFRLTAYNEATHKLYYEGKFTNTNYIATGNIVWNTLLGPLSIGLNYYSSSNDKLLFNINFGYLLFNPGRPE